MTQTKFKLLDESGDRKYFTIVPNYILNHSTAIDQALYLQMKRYAGENGKCFATQETLCKQLGVGRWAFNKSIKYLIEHRWIDQIGTTKSRTRPIRTYKVNDIWQENTDYYQKIPSGLAVSSEKIPSGLAGDTAQISSKIPPRLAVEEEPVKQEPLRRISNGKSVAELRQPSGNQMAPELLKIFEQVNPSIKRMYGNKTQRASAENLVKQFGLEVVLRGAQAAVSILGQPYAPKITTPFELETSWAKLVAFLKEHKPSAKVML